MRSERSTENNNPGLRGRPVLKRWDTALFLLACAASAFLIRYLALPKDVVINGDGVYYATLASRLISGNVSDGISAYWSPLYTLLLGVAHVFINDLEFAGRMVSLVAGSLVVVPAYILIRNFFGNVAGYIGTILVVVHPFLITSAGWVMTESLYILIFTSAVISGWFALEQGRPLVFLLTGCLFGLAFLTKPESIGFVVLFSVLLGAMRLTEPRWKVRRLIASYLIFLSSFALFVLPYVVFIHQKTGQWTVSQKLVSNSTFNEPGQGMLNLTDDGSTTLQDRIWWDDYATEVLDADAQPSLAGPSADTPDAGFKIYDFSSRTFNNLRRQLRRYVPALLPLPFLLIGAIGFITAPWTRARATKDVYLLSFVACTFVGYAATVTELRYIFALIPIFMGWTGLGCDNIGRFAASKLQSFLRVHWEIKPVAIHVSLTLILIASLTPLFAKQVGPSQIELVPFEEKAAGLWLRHNSEPHPLVMAPDARVAFYAGADHIFLPDEEVQTIREYARRRKVTHIVLSERRLKQRPAVYGLGDGELGNLRLIYEDNAFDGYNVKIYRVVE